MVAEDNPAVKLGKVKRLVLGRIEELEEREQESEPFSLNWTKYNGKKKELKRLEEEMNWK